MWLDRIVLLSPLPFTHGFEKTWFIKETGNMSHICMLTGSLVLHLRGRLNDQGKNIVSEVKLISIHNILVR